jgi:hypothetical protein
MISLLDRFWSKVEKSDGCWRWLGGHAGGRPFFYLGKGNVPAYRVAYILTHGQIPEGTEIDHLCKNPSCVRPDHLEAVSHRENMRRSDSIVGINMRKTICKRGHPLVPWSKTGKNAHQLWRKCHQCAMQSQRLRRAAKKGILTANLDSSKGPNLGSSQN